MPKKFASGTIVSIGKSKADITALLREWGCDSIAWGEDFRDGVIALRFVWTHNELSYAARIQIQLPTEKEIRERPEMLDKRNGRVLEGRVEDALKRNGQQQLRVLLLWLKGAFNAVDAGILKPEVIFLPFFVNKSNETVADLLLPRLQEVMHGNMKLLKA